MNLLELIQKPNISVENIEAKIKNGANLTIYDNTWGHTLLHAAIYKRKPIEVIQTLLEHGVDVNAKNKTGATPLYYAVLYYKDSIELLQLLIKYGADVNEKDNYGNTPFHEILKVMTPNIVFPIVKLFIENGADVNAKTESGVTPLMIACANSKIEKEIIIFMINHGADVNSTDNSGNSVLMRMIKSYPPIENLKVILDHGADLYIKNNNGKTVFDELKKIYDDRVSKEIYRSHAKKIGPPKLDVPTDKILQIARKLWSHNGPICDMRGFTQHHGECWNDSFQTMFVNSDLIKSVVQELFINGDIGPAFYKITIEDYRKIIEYVYSKNTQLYDTSSFQKEGVNDDILKKLNSILAGYTEFFQRRFLRHYINTIQTDKEPYCGRGINSYYCSHYGRLLRDKFETIENIDEEVSYCVITELNNRLDIINGSTVDSIGIFYTYLLNRYIQNIRRDRIQIHVNSVKINDGFLDFYKGRPDIFRNEYFVYMSFRSGTFDGHAVGFYNCGVKPYYINDNYSKVYEFPFQQYFEEYVSLTSHYTEGGKEKVNMVIFIVFGSIEKYKFSTENREVFLELFNSTNVHNPLIEIIINDETHYKDILTGKIYILKNNTNDTKIIKSTRFVMEGIYTFHNGIDLPVGGYQNLTKKYRKTRRRLRNY